MSGRLLETSLRRTGLFPLARELRHIVRDIVRAGSHGYLAISVAIVYAWHLIKRRDVYAGTHAFYHSVQSGGRAARFGQTLLARAAVDLDYANEHRDRARISDALIADYANESGLGYNDWDYDKGGEALEQQQRGLILPLLETIIPDLAAGSTIVEIGSGNGDVISLLAGRYPDHSFVGVDLNTNTAQRKHDRQNLSFRSGYALDLLERGDLRGELVFLSSTTILFTPAELRAYLQTIRDAGFRHVVLNEPTWGGHHHRREARAASMHLERHAWHHEYPGYLAEAGYRTSHFEAFHYGHPVSTRPDIEVILLAAELESGSR